MKLIWVLAVAIVLAFVAIGGAAGFLVSKQITPVYQGSATLIVGNLTTSPEITKNDFETATLLASTYATLVRSKVVLGRVTRQLHLPYSWGQLKDRVQAYVGPNSTPLVSVTVFGTSPHQAQAIAAAIAARAVSVSPGVPVPPGGSTAYATGHLTRLENKIKKAEAKVKASKAKLTSVTSAGARRRLHSLIFGEQQRITRLQKAFAPSTHFLAHSESTNLLRVLEPASAGSNPIRPRKSIDIVLGAAMGAIVGLLAAFIFVRRRRRSAPGARSGIDPATERRAPMLPGRSGDPWLGDLTQPVDERR